MLILVGPSASGKTEVANILINKYGMQRMVTHTTREKRLGEVNGVSYYFIDKNKFLEKLSNNEFVETTVYNGNYYGSLKENISRDKIIILEPNGVNAFLKEMPNDVKIVLLKTSKLVRKERMIKRGDKLVDIEKRLENDDLTFEEKNLNRIDLIVFNETKSLEDISHEIYSFYQKMN